MIANDGLAGAVFGTGRLLDDLIQYVYAGTGCRLMLIGDTAQLPPVGEEESPALSADKLRGYGMEGYETQLTEVVPNLFNNFVFIAGHADKFHTNQPSEGILGIES